MNILSAVILGIVQGFTEFLPVSSSGHLIIFEKVLGVNQPGMMFDVIVHMGTLLAVFIVFWKDIWALISKPFQKMTFLLIIATLPTVVGALFFSDLIASMFDSGKYIAFGFIYTGCILLFADKVSKSKENKKEEKDITYIDALVIGLMQMIAMVPAVSRSGSTISGALGRKINREAAAKFSFMMSIPAVLGALILQIKDIVTGKELIANFNVTAMVFGFFAAAIAGYFAITLMLEIIKKCKLKYFAYYVFVLAGIILFDQFVTHIFFVF